MKMSALPADFKDPVRLLQNLRTKPEKHWIKRGEARVLKLFQLMAQRVPAYKDFLKKRRVNPKKIKTIKDFKQVPTIDKDNYLRTHPLEQLCWDGKLEEKRWTFATTSGSTGEPSYFPREDAQDWQYAATAELYLRTNFEIHKKSTLYIDGWAMGAWIGGLFTYQAVKHLSERGGYKLSIITPGIFKQEIIKAVKNLGHLYDQVIIGGYPPFIKDTIDNGIEQGLNWGDYNLGFIFSAEGFTEIFRDYIIRKTGLKDVYKSTLNHYGTVDLGTMAHETPLSILLRRMAVNNSNIYSMIFSDVEKLPTLAQYVPELFYFEAVNGSLICSAFSGLPLVRYDLKDHGGVFNLSDITKRLSADGIDLHEEAKKAKISNTVWNLPFVYVYERRDFIVKLYGANIYPENIRNALYNKEIEGVLTGKFTMIINFDSLQNQFLEINVELRSGVKESDQLEKRIQEIIIKQLLKENSEYRSNYKEAPSRQTPKIVLWKYEHPRHFKPGVKQKWVK